MLPSRLQKNYPTRAQVEAYVDKTIDADITRTDANDFIYYVNASRNYNPAPKLSTITAPVLWINSADDFINPPELGDPRKISSLPRCRTPNSSSSPSPTPPEATAPTPYAAVWKQYLIDFMAATEPK